MQRKVRTWMFTTMKEEWTAANMTPDHVIFVSGVMNEKGIMKAEQIKAYGIDIMIDDDIANLEDIYRIVPTTKCILFGKRNCRSTIPVKCAATWPETIQAIENISLIEEHWK